jgi:deoxyribonuclease-1
MARSIFYMCKEYGFPVDPDMLTVLKKWNRDDLPTRAEKARNDKIEKIQGTRNPFIDKPSRATKLQCAIP